MQFTLQTLLISFVVVASALAAFEGGGLVVAAVILAVAGYIRSSESPWLAARNVFIVFVLGGCLVGLMLPAISQVREEHRRADCLNNMKQIELALHVYHEKHGRFPPAYVLGPDGKPWHSWRTLILPYLEEKPLYDKYRFDEPWDGPNNIKLAAVRLPGFTCPSDPTTPAGNTHYVAVVGSETMWAGARPVSLGECKDGSGSTIHLVEANQSIPWSQPQDIDFAELCASIESGRAPLLATRHAFAVDDYFVRYNKGPATHVTLADGSARPLDASLPLDDVRALLTRAGGDAFDLNWYLAVPRPHWGHIGGLICLVLSTLLLLLRPIRRQKP